MRSPWLWVAALAAAAVLCWLPFLGRTPSPDEGGLLTVAGQWAPGSSLYGDYWVDRPPLLIGLFALADGLGGALALRVMGLVAVALTVVLAGVIGRLAAGRQATTRAVVLPAATAALLLATPLFGSTVVSAELLGLPFVLAGIAAALVSLQPGRTGPPRRGGRSPPAPPEPRRSWSSRTSWTSPCSSPWWPSLSRRRAAGLRLLGGAAVGAVAMTAVVLGVAATRGTGPAGVWDAVVVFRARGGRHHRPVRQPRDRQAAGRGAGRPPVQRGAAARRRAGPDVGPGRAGDGRPAGLRSAAWALLAWEMFVVLVGGGYWLHYLMGLVPGLVVLAAASAQASPRRTRWLVAAYAYTACSTVAVLCWVLVNPIERPEESAIAYLAAHARPGDTAVVAFGTPNILQGAGLQSPYPQLWSLPARVRDPQARELTDVLTGPEAPTWLVVSGRSVTTWGIDGAAANRIVRSRYEPAASAGNFRIYVRKERP